MKRIEEINKQLYELAKKRDFLENETKFDEYAIYSLDNIYSEMRKLLQKRYEIIHELRG